MKVFQLHIQYLFTIIIHRVQVNVIITKILMFMFCLFLQVIFKKLYKNSAREQGTVRYFREKLQRRNVTIDVKHYEDCEQLFLTLAKCFTVEALVQFFGMETKDGHITRNRPPYYILDVGDKKRQY